MVCDKFSPWPEPYETNFFLLCSLNLWQGMFWQTDRLVIEGKTPAEIRAERAEQGLPIWDIWTMGCPGGE